MDPVDIIGDFMFIDHQSIAAIVICRDSTGSLGHIDNAGLIHGAAAVEGCQVAVFLVILCPAVIGIQLAAGLAGPHCTVSEPEIHISMLTGSIFYHAGPAGVAAGDGQINFSIGIRCRIGRFIGPCCHGVEVAINIDFGRSCAGAVVVDVDLSALCIEGIGVVGCMEFDGGVTVEVDDCTVFDASLRGFAISYRHAIGIGFARRSHIDVGGAFNGDGGILISHIEAHRVIFHIIGGVSCFGCCFDGQSIFKDRRTAMDHVRIHHIHQACAGNPDAHGFGFTGDRNIGIALEVKVTVSGNNDSRRGLSDRGGAGNYQFHRMASGIDIRIFPVQTDNAIVLFAIRNSSIGSQGNSAVFGELVEGRAGSFLQDSCLDIGFILCLIAGDLLAEFRIGLFRRNIFCRGVVIVTLAFGLRSGGGGGVGNVPGLQGCGGRREAVGNLHGALQVPVRVAGVEQFLRQLVQHFADPVPRIGGGALHVDAAVVGQQGDGGVLVRLRDGEGPSGDAGGILCIMLVDHRAVSTIAIHGNGICIILENNACLTSRSTGESCNAAACK